MKKIYLPILLASAALFTVGCNQDLLEIPQKGVTAIETFYQTEEDCESALVSAYAGFGTNIASRGSAFIYAPMRALFNLPGDDIYAAGSNFGDNDFMGALNEFRYDSSSEVVNNMYQGFYLSLYRFNLVIDNFKDGVPDGGQTAATKRCVAEARVMRAYIHMMLAIGWGCPPLIDHCLTGNDLPYRCDEDPENPMTHEELLVWCAKECEAALSDLSERSSTADKNGVVVATKGFANAVAGKAYLFAGKNAEAKAALKRVIDSGKYALVPGDRFWENFHIEGDCNEEKIFEANIEYNSGIGAWSGINQRSTWMEAQIWNWRSDHFQLAPNAVYGGCDGWGGLGVPQEFADAFYTNDGPDSYRFNTTFKAIDDAVYNMPYGVEEVDNMTLEEKMNSKLIGINDVNNGLYGQSFWLPFKQLIRTTDVDRRYGSTIRLNNYTIMRYAEVLLLYAEACLNTGDSGQATWAVNQIQQRAGSKTVSASVDMNTLKKEKNYELWLEGCRWPDMVRWGDLDGAKKAGSNVPKLYDKLFRAPQSGDKDIKWQYGSESNSRFYTVSSHEAMDRGDKVGFVAGKHEVYPFPFQVTSINPNLTQNPEWE